MHIRNKNKKGIFDSIKKLGFKFETLYRSRVGFRYRNNVGIVGVSFIQNLHNYTLLAVKNWLTEKEKYIFNNKPVFNLSGKISVSNSSLH